jgi:hypothetical protein
MKGVRMKKIILMILVIMFSLVNTVNAETSLDKSPLMNFINSHPDLNTPEMITLLSE